MYRKLSVGFRHYITTRTPTVNQCSYRHPNAPHKHPAEHELPHVTTSSSIISSKNNVFRFHRINATISTNTTKFIILELHTCVKLGQLEVYDQGLATKFLDMRKSSSHAIVISFIKLRKADSRGELKYPCLKTLIYLIIKYH